MSNPYRDCLADLYTWANEHCSRYQKTADVMHRTRVLLAQPELPELTDEALTMTYAYAVAAAVGNRRGPYKLEDAEAAQLAGLRAAIAADRARRIP